MADETEKKSMVLSAQEIAYHAEALYKKEWDAERNAIRNPNMVFLGLLAYVRLTATRLYEAEERVANIIDENAKRLHAALSRLSELETRLTTMERWKAEAEAQTSEMVKAAEEMMTAGPSALKERLREVLSDSPLNGEKEEVS